MSIASRITLEQCIQLFGNNRTVAITNLVSHKVVERCTKSWNSLHCPFKVNHITHTLPRNMYGEKRAACPYERERGISTTISSINNNREPNSVRSPVSHISCKLHHEEETIRLDCCLFQLLLNWDQLFFLDWPSSQLKHVRERGMMQEPLCPIWRLCVDPPFRKHISTTAGLAV